MELNSEVYSSFEGVSFDHQIVTAKMLLSLRRNTTQTTTTVTMTDHCIITVILEIDMY